VVRFNLINDYHFGVRFTERLNVKILNKIALQMRFLLEYESPAI